jgi:hypothetical protein
VLHLAVMKDWSLLYLISEWAIRFVMLIYVPQKRSAAASRTWLLFIFLLPWPGLILYWLFGRIYLPARRVRMQERASRFIREAQAQIGPRVTVRCARIAPDPKLVLRKQRATRSGDLGKAPSYR